MRKSTWMALTCGALLSAAAWAHDESRAARASELSGRAAPGVIERGLARLERAVARLEARLAGRGGSMMEGCADMMAGGGMMGGGMMGGSQPNERWRSSPPR